MLQETIQSRPEFGRQKAAVNPQVPVSFGGGPLCKIRVVAFSGNHQGCQKMYLIPPKTLQDPGNNLFLGLRFDRNITPGTVLGSEFSEQQPQEMVDLRHGCHRALAPAPAGPLFDGHGRRNTEHAIHIGAAGRLHELPGVGVEGLQIPALSFGKQDIEGQGAFTAAADPGHHCEPVPRYGYVYSLQVVFPGVADGDVVIRRGSLMIFRLPHRYRTVRLPITPQRLSGVAAANFEDIPR
ncbi:hypothetical protein ES708_25077 [subsurface metagenome]